MPKKKAEAETVETAVTEEASVQPAAPKDGEETAETPVEEPATEEQPQPAEARAPRSRSVQSGAVVNLISRNSGRPVLMERGAIEHWANRIQSMDARAFERPGRTDALMRKLSQPLAMEDDWEPPPLEEGLVYTPRYIGDPDDTGYCWALKSGIAMMCADTPLLDEGLQICGVNFHGYDTLLAGMKEASADPRVKAIFLKMDSPGGVATGGIIGLAKWMRANRASAGGKPIWVFAKMACSAAQWIAAQADRIVAPELAYVGSVGCYTVHYDYSAAYEKMGVKVTEFAMWENKTDGADWKPMSDSAQADTMADVEQIVKMFAADMTAGRPQLSFEKLKDMRSRAFYSRHDDPQRSGLALGLVDAIMTEEEAFIALLTKVSGNAAADAVKPGGPQPAGQDDPGGQDTSSEPSPADEAAPQVAKEDGAIVDLASMRQKTRSEAAADAVEIIELCKLAEAPELAADFIRTGVSIAQVREQLQMRRTEASEARKISGHILPDAGDRNPKAAADGWERAIVSARGRLKDN